jgi:hypothetical protein
MKIYQLQSAKLPEPVTFEYNSKGLLTAFKSTGLSEDQCRWLFARFPFRTVDIPPLNKLKNVKIIEVPVEVDFEKFFTNYSALYGSRVDRKKAETTWKRLSKAAQLAAYEYIPRYYAKCKRLGVAPKYAKTYLNNEPWND